MDKQTLDCIKRLELKILIHIDEICRKNNIRYYLIGGTLLGAIRHKGFIPWDDDIDIVMFREDYNKFLEVIKNGDETFFVQNSYTDKHYSRYITKVRLNGTLFVERLVKDVHMHHGIFIDIFPLDMVIPSNHKRVDMRVRLSKSLLRIPQIKTGLTGGKSSFATKRNKLLSILLKIAPSKMIIQLVDFIYVFDNNKHTKFVTNFSSQYGWRKQTFPVDVYGEGTYLEFEGHQFMAPTKWEVILNSLYGDYMKLPPEEKRSSGHDVVHIDLGKYAEN